MIKKIMAFLLVLLVLFSSCSSAFAAKKKILLLRLNRYRSLLCPRTLRIMTRNILKIFLPISFMRFPLY